MPTEQSDTTAARERHPAASRRAVLRAGTALTVAAGAPGAALADEPGDQHAAWLAEWRDRWFAEGLHGAESDANFNRILELEDLICGTAPRTVGDAAAVVDFALTSSTQAGPGPLLDRALTNARDFLAELAGRARA